MCDRGLAMCVQSLERSSPLGLPTTQRIPTGIKPTPPQVRTYYIVLLCTMMVSLSDEVATKIHCFEQNLGGVPKCKLGRMNLSTDRPVLISPPSQCLVIPTLCCARERQTRSMASICALRCTQFKRGVSTWSLKTEGAVMEGGLRKEDCRRSPGICQSWSHYLLRTVRVFKLLLLRRLILWNPW